MDKRIVKIDVPEAQGIQKFEYAEIRAPKATPARNQQDFRKPAHPAYETGAAAQAAASAGARSRKDSRFSINPLLRGPLGIEEEERQLIEQKVQARLAEVTEAAREEAREQGYREGLQKGYEEAFRRFQAEGAARLEKLEALIREFDGAKERMFQANERFLIEMVYRIARMILLQEAKADREYILRLAKELVERVGLRDNITIRIHPEDMNTAAMIKEGLEKSLGAMKNLLVLESAEVHQGGCIFSSEWSSIDASIETQLANVYQSLLGGGANAANG